jgi:hypothetical protein
VIRLLTRAECASIRARIQNITIIDPRVTERVEEQYDRAALRDAILGTWKPEEFLRSES